MFRNRIEAGHALAGEIPSLLDGPVVLAAIPRGGVPVARPLAERLGAPLALVHARKLVVPRAGEFAVGAVDEEGYALFDDLALDALRIDAGELEAAQIRAAREIGRQMGCVSGPSLRLLGPDTTLVLVDDALATGWTMRAALAFARRHGARRATIAVPCASEPAAEYFREHADRFLCPIVDDALLAVGEHYEDFSPVDDEAMRELLTRPIDVGDRMITARPIRGQGRHHQAEGVS